MQRLTDWVQQQRVGAPSNFLWWGLKGLPSTRDQAQCKRMMVRMDSSERGVPPGQLAACEQGSCMSIGWAQQVTLRCCKWATDWGNSWVLHVDSRHWTYLHPLHRLRGVYVP